jgi:hypothetical protein
MARTPVVPCTDENIFVTIEKSGFGNSMSKSSIQICARTAGIAACAVALSLLASPSQAQPGPFAGLSGSWAGSGTIGMSDGTRARIRCRASYVVDGGGSSLQQSLRCASDSYQFQLSSDVRYAGGSISGSWSEATRGVGGSLSGIARGADIRARAEGPGFAANLSLATRGDRQLVSIRASDGDIAEVSMVLSRRGR